MALIKCPECGKDVSDKAAVCPNCANPIANENDGMAYPVEVNGQRIDLFAIVLAKVSYGKKAFCISDTAEIITELAKRANAKVKDVRSIWFQNESNIKEMHKDYMEANDDGSARCPRCGSTSLSGNKKGFGIGKAIVGSMLTGGIGLVAGNIGAKKVCVTCLKCGKQFKAGKG
jgi:DNA-directed RNA polymerase subunit RPC12/RpoP